VDGGWSERALGEVFRLDIKGFTGKPMPQSHSDSDCGCYFGGGCWYLVVVSWMEIGRVEKDEAFAAMENEREVE
jgi:hypothetical protein